MIKVIAMYKHPHDVEHFNRYYFSTHIPIAKTMPGLKSYQVSRAEVRALDGLSPYHLVATLSFESQQAVETALHSPQGQATAADLANFATGGVEIIVFEEDSV